jgi:site-specific DNA recombinase
MPFGTGYGLYGYIWHKGGPKMGIKQPRTINEYEATIVRQIFKDLANGMGRFTIARKLNAAGIPSKSGAKWHPLTIGRMAKNAAYCGDTYVGQYKSDSQAKRVIQPRENWTLLPDITPPIIEKALFERVQAILSHPRAIQKSEYLLTGHVACAACGGPMCGARMAKLHRYYGCRHTMPTASEPATCKARYIRADFIEPFVWNKVIEVLKNPDVLLAEFKRQVKDKAKGIPARLEQDIKRLTYKIETYPAKEKHLVDELADEANDELRDALLDGLNRQRKECKEAKSQFATLLAQKQELKWSEPLRLNA